MNIQQVRLALALQCSIQVGQGPVLCCMVYMLNTVLLFLSQKVFACMLRFPCLLLDSLAHLSSTPHVVHEEKKMGCIRSLIN